MGIGTFSGNPMPICTPLRCLLPTALTLLLGACATQAPQPTPQASIPLPQHGGVGPVFSSCERPVYPADALASKATGTVTIYFLISQDGSVVKTKLARSSGHASLDQAAISGLARCRFKPPMSEGRAVQAWVPVQYVWTPDE